MGQQLKRLMNQMQMAQNPQMALNQMLLNNPNIAKAFEFIRQSGGNPQTAFLNYAKQLGVNPQDVIQQLKQQLQ